MGIQGSSSSQLQALPKSNWQQIQSTVQGSRPVHYGKYKLYTNTITFEQVESYSLHFQSNQECQDYLLIFRKRLRDEYLVNSRFIDLQNINLCGCGKLANVYLEHIPIRLIDIQEIQEQDYLYVLLTALKGFQKLYNLNGYFRPCAEMIGFDLQARLKVWFNPNFSKTFTNHGLTQSFTDLTLSYRTDFQEQMVWEIIELISKKAPNQRAFNRYQQIFQLRPEEELKLNFNLAKLKVHHYALINGIEIKKYFDSILPVIRHINQSSEQFPHDGNSMDIDGHSFFPIQRKDKIIYYINPFEASQGDSSHSEQSEVHTYRVQLQQDTEKQKSISIGFSDKTPINALTSTNNQATFKKADRALSQQSQLSSSRKRPRIKFNYNNYNIAPVIVLQPYYYSTNDSISYFEGSKLDTPLEVIVQKAKTEKEQSNILPTTINYKDMYEDLELDQEIKKDLMRLNKV